MQITEQNLNDANGQLKMLSYYPTDAETQAAIMRLLAKICPHVEALEWLVNTFVDRIGKWHGPAELRAVLCWKYRPSDGVELDSALAGFRPLDGEALSIERHNERRQLWNRALPFKRLQ